MIALDIDARGIATLTLNRPEKHNALDGATLAQLHEALLRIEQDAAVRALVLTGAGVSFCAGADIAHMRSMLDATEQQNIDDALLLANCLRTLDELPKPVIARINGNVFGGGVGLVACADIAIAVDSAKFALTEVRLGLVPAVISPYVVRAVGSRQARRLFLTAAAITAEQARAVQLVHFVTASEHLDTEVESQMDLILRGGPNALAAAKKLLRDVTDIEDRGRLAQETAALLASLRVSAEGKEGLSAFLERRNPNWRK